MNRHYLKPTIGENNLGRSGASRRPQLAKYKQIQKSPETHHWGSNQQSEKKSRYFQNSRVNEKNVQTETLPEEINEFRRGGIIYRCLIRE